MSSERTGYALGTLSPTIYFENAAGEIALPANLEMAQAAKPKMEALGWMWKEATTLAEVDRLQQRLIDLEAEKLAPHLRNHEAMRAELRRQTGSNLRQKMMSGSTSQWEKDFIAAYLELREERRDKYRESFSHHQQFLWAREMDAKTPVTDVLEWD